MKCLDLTLPAPAENLACDEALLEACEAGECDEVLRFWEPEGPFVVVGFSNRIRREVHWERCRSEEVPVLRRLSGGGTVVQAAGCLNYSLILRVDEAGPTGTVSGSNCWILKRMAGALATVLNDTPEVLGQTDLGVCGRKFSGNAQKRRRRALLFHGSLLLDFDLGLIERLLPHPSREPDYRKGRGHCDFLMNLGVTAAPIKEALRSAWGVRGAIEPPPEAKIRSLCESRYSLDEWNLRWMD